MAIITSVGCRPGASAIVMGPRGYISQNSTLTIQQRGHSMGMSQTAVLTYTMTRGQPMQTQPDPGECWPTFPHPFTRTDLAQATPEQLEQRLAVLAHAIPVLEARLRGLRLEQCLVQGQLRARTLHAVVNEQKDA